MTRSTSGLLLQHSCRGKELPAMEQRAMTSVTRVARIPFWVILLSVCSAHPTFAASHSARHEVPRAHPYLVRLQTLGHRIGVLRHLP